jgi:hypothetical protein
MVRASNIFRWWLPLALLSAGGCFSSRPAEPGVDEQFGHRQSGPDALGREVVDVAAGPAAGNHLVFSMVSVDSVQVRVEQHSDDLGRQRVDVLVKGALAETCLEIDAIRQERFANIISVDLTIRRPRGTACAMRTRPFRLYFDIDEPLETGSYTLRLNREYFPFEVRMARRR